jgi:hypothetical protein
MILPGEPVAFIHAPHGARVTPDISRAITSFLSGPLKQPRRVRCLRQVYRQFDFMQGGPVRDVVGPVDSTLPAGQPLLVAAILAGEEQPVSMAPRRVTDVEGLPVVFEDDSDDDAE